MRACLLSISCLQAACLVYIYTLRLRVLQGCIRPRWGVCRSTTPSSTYPVYDVSNKAQGGREEGGEEGVLICRLP